MRTLTAPFYGVLEFLPEKERWCLCILSDGTVRSGYYNPDGITDKTHCFWDTDSEGEGTGIGRNGVTVEFWTYSESVKVQ